VTEPHSEATVSKVARHSAGLPDAGRDEVLAVLRSEVARAVEAALDRGIPPDAIDAYVETRIGWLRSTITNPFDVGVEDFPYDPDNSSQLGRVGD